MARMTRELACELAQRHGIDLSADFHAMHWGDVWRILDAADEWGYKTPRNANGSRARYFFAFLARKAMTPR